jgi:hypothetical protein
MTEAHPTIDEARRRIAARAAGLPLSASWAEISDRTQGGRGLPVDITADVVQADRDARALEKAEQTEIAKAARAFGGKVYNLSQPRASKQSPGIPDLWLVFRRVRLAVWWETKRQVGGRLSPAQVEFADECHHCGVAHGSGDRHAFAAWLVRAGIAYRTPDGTLEPTRSESAA